MADATAGPETLSAEAQSMQEAWTLIGDILAGAVRIRERGEIYLPRFEDESRAQYDRRKKSAPWRPEFDDALRSLASKPFDKDVGLRGDVKTEIKALAEDVDGRGNNLTSFGREVFGKAIGKGLHAILVDYPPMTRADGSSPVSRAEEKAARPRPYWIQVDASDIVALYTDWDNGKEFVSHVRIREKVVSREGFKENVADRIRVLEPGHWEIWEKSATTSRYEKTDEGVVSRGSSHAASVPLVLFYTGERSGELAVKPPLVDLAHLQIELYQALSRQDEILTFAGSPMLAAQGMAPPMQAGPDGSMQPVKITVGPKSVLFAPSTGDAPARWDYIQPDAKNIGEIRAHVESITCDMRRLGMQPLTPQSGRPTATGQSIEAAKAHSAVQAWAMGLKDALEQAWKFTAEWLGEPDTIECDVSTDFSVQPYADAPLNALDKARARRDISIETYWDGLRRFDVLAPDFDHDKELVKVEAEWTRFGATPERDPATGKKIDVNTPPPAA